MEITRKVERPIPEPIVRSVEANEPDNRATQVRRDNDTSGNFIIGLYQNDDAIKYYFDNVIRPIVEENGQSVPVPIMYGNPDRWNSIRKLGFMRDKNNRLLTPVIVYKRTGMEKRRDLSRNIDAQNIHVFQTFKANYNPINIYDNFSAMMGAIGEKELMNVVVPDYFRLSYEFIIWTDYIVHMNKIIEAISFSESSYWGNDQFKFYAVINNFSPTVEVQSGEDRAVKTNFELSLFGFVIPDALQKEIIQKSIKGYSFSKVKFDISTVDQITTGTGRDGTTKVIYSDIITSSTYNFSYEVLYYLNTDITKTADILTPTTATFSGEHFAAAPSSLPNTSIRDFDFYLNGQYLNQDDLTFTELGDNLVMSFKVGAVEYTINPETDEVVAVGKFAE